MNGTPTLGDAHALGALTEAVISEPSAPLVSIIIPTFRRPGRAIAAALSVHRQSARGGFEIVLVDNDPQASALPLIRKFASSTSAPVIAVHEPNPGVASARNAGLRAARGEIIAFLDDDQTASGSWLDDLLRVMDQSGADVVFGPVITRFDTPPDRHLAYFEAFFARTPDHDEGLIDTFYGCGCSLVRRASLPSAQPFETSRNESGGEDDALFQAMFDAGRRFAWAPGAAVFEQPDPKRLSLSYTLRRSFAYGQGPVRIARASPANALRETCVWMIVGAGQMLIYGAAALLAIIARWPRRAFLYRRFAEGAGKVFWFKPFRPKFYGASQLAAGAPAPISGGSQISREAHTSSAPATRSA
ncbi:glycosyltransferase [bacterium]|nr:glycosyltransferase [bacterium]